MRYIIYSPADSDDERDSFFPYEGSSKEDVIEQIVTQHEINTENNRKYREYSL